MKRGRVVKRVHQAQAKLARLERELSTDRQTPSQGYGLLALLAGGFAGGIALGLLPLRWWSRIGGALATTTAQVARSTLTPTFMAAMLARLRPAQSAATDQDAATVH